MYRRALRTLLSSVKPRAKTGSGWAVVRPASSIHFAAPQSDCCSRPVSNAAGVLHAEASPLTSYTRTCHTAGWRDGSGSPP